MKRWQRRLPLPLIRLSLVNEPTIVWLRLDLRVADNPALHHAVKRGGPVIPVFIWAPEEETPWAPGAASRWWLHQSLRALAASLKELGSTLILRRGPSLQTLRLLIRETGATAAFWNRRYEPIVIVRDTQIKAELRKDNIEVETFNAALLREPWEVQNKSGRPFQVFTPFWKHCLSLPEPPRPLPVLSEVPRPSREPKTVPLKSLKLEPSVNWAAGFREVWTPGEAGAQANLGRFQRDLARNYSDSRNRPDLPGTSRLSPHLHFGEIGPRQIWKASRAGTSGQAQFINEIGWREFAHHLLFHFPNTPEEPLRPEFAKFRWRTEPDWLKAWQQGKTGYPIVDAGMRELWATGWMHNRVRMITASFLIKDLLISWQSGARWFWDTLVDADLAQNTLGWQWVAGCGADAAPYFRIFNPVTQAEKFDPKGDYIRRWCPELRGLADSTVHQPWVRRGENDLGTAGIPSGEAYPERLVSHAIAREVALEEYARIRKQLRV